MTLENGDDTKIYIPSGAVETAENKNLTVSIEKLEAGNTSITLARAVYEITARETRTSSEPAYTPHDHTDRL